MPSPSADATHIHPRANAGATGFEYLTDAEFWDALVSSVGLPYEPADRTAGHVWINTSALQAVENRTEAVTLGEARGNLFAMLDARAEPHVVDEAWADSIAFTQRAYSEPTNEPLSVVEAKIDRVAWGEARTEAPTFTESRSDSLPMNLTLTESETDGYGWTEARPESITVGEDKADVINRAFAEPCTEAITVTEDRTDSASGNSDFAPYNPGFESPIGASEGDNWWPYANPGPYGGAEAYRSNGTGNYRTGYGGIAQASGGDDGDGGPFQGAQAALFNRTTKTLLGAGSGLMPFYYKLYAPYDSGSARVYVKLEVYNSGGTKISTETNDAHLAKIAGGSFGSAAYSGIYRTNGDTAWTRLNYDMKTHANAICDWALAAKIVFSVWVEDLNYASPAVFLDDFGAA